MIIGKQNQTAIGTIVERQTGYVMLLHLPEGYKPEQVRDVLAAKIKTLPESLRRTIEEMRATIQQAASTPDASEPREEFVTGLHQRLRAEIEGQTDSYDAAQPPPAPAHPHRRRVLQVAAGAAGAAALFAAGEKVDQLRTPDSGGGTLDPEAGRWTPVATQAEVTAHSAVTFSVANVAGVVTTDTGRLAALSGICTHQGCLLRLDAAQRRLDCPCHATAFSLTGDVLHHALRKAPPPLPHLQVRQRDGHIEVLLPPGLGCGRAISSPGPGSMRTSGRGGGSCRSGPRRDG